LDNGIGAGAVVEHLAIEVGSEAVPGAGAGPAMTIGLGAEGLAEGLLAEKHYLDRLKQKMCEIDALQ
jgi:hypothetical protein